MHFDLHRPTSVEEALALYQQTGGSYLAGGTVLLVNHHNGADIGRHLISLEGVRTLHGIRETEDGIAIGSCVTMDEIDNSPLLREHAFALWQSAAEIGGPQIRNRATIAGNIAGGSPASDIAAPLLALGAVLCLQGPDGCRELPVKDLFVHVFKTNLLPGEIITEIFIPRKTGRVSRFVKVGKRNALAISCINMSVAHDPANGWSVAVGAAAPTPRLCARTMEILNAGVLDDERIRRACAEVITEIAPIDDRWATASYRRKVCANLLKSMVKEVLA
jgi:carbon-monoxide dehydrogenase medium subunit